LRVPFLAMWAGVQGNNQVIEENVQNIDISVTFMDIAGADFPSHMDGQSFAPLLEGASPEWRDTIYYEYFWERPFPQTPTVHAIRTDKYKFIRYHGIWDLNEL
jgi:arylsulfatase A-like enzyme